METYWLRTNRYQHPHVPTVLGLDIIDNESYAVYTVWVVGKEPAVWEVHNIHVNLEEYSAFSGAFRSAGIVMHDITESDDGRAGDNIILHPDYDLHEAIRSMPVVENDGYHKDLVIIPAEYWTRIDFGNTSLTINSGKLDNFLKENRGDLIRILGTSNFRLLELAVDTFRHRNSRTPQRMQEINSLLAPYLQDQLINSGQLQVP